MLLDPAQDYPLLRDFPWLPSKAVAVGEKWKSEGVRVVNPLRRGGTRVPFLCEYEYMGMKEYNGAPGAYYKKLSTRSDTAGVRIPLEMRTSARCRGGISLIFTCPQKRGSRPS